MGDDDAQHGVAQKLQPFVGLQTTAGALVDVRGVYQRGLEQSGGAEGVAQRSTESVNSGRRIVHVAGQPNLTGWLASRSVRDPA
jgi:hypothetical protein